MFDDAWGQEPWWGGPLRELFGVDEDTGWMDSGAALDAMAWLGRRVFEQSRTDRGFHNRAGLLSQVQATAAATNSLAAVQAVRLAQFAATDTDPGTDPAHSTDSAAAPRLSDAADDRCPAGAGLGDGPRERLHPLGFKAEFADVEVGAALCLGPGAAAGRVEESIDAVTKTPRLLREMGAGRIDPYRVSLVTRELIEAGRYTCERAEDELLARGVTGWTSGRITRRTRPLVARLDPAAARVAWRHRAKDSIGVFARPGREDGTTELTAVLWTRDALEVHRAIESLARGLHESTMTSKSLGECRSDALVDLVISNTQVDTSLTLMIPVRTATITGQGGPTGPGTVGGLPPGDTTAPRGTATPGSTTNSSGGTDPMGTGPAGSTLGPADSRIGAAVAALLAGVDWDDELAGMIDWGRDPRIGHDAPRHRPPPHPPGTAPPPGAGPLRRPAEPAASPPVTGGDVATLQPPTAEPEPEPRRMHHPTGPHPEVGPGPQAPPETPPDAIGDVDVPGIGTIPALVVRKLITTVGATITRVLVDPATGALRESATTTYRPTARIRRFVAQRDLHCRFPGCGRDARYCDADHVIPWPQGETTPANLQLLCRHHHRAKHEGGWQVTMTPDGTCTWTSPTGRTLATTPGITDVIADLTITPGPGPLPG